ncbi:cobaltochelatase CobT-related protein [Paraburkholderia fungorum]
MPPNRRGNAGRSCIGATGLVWLVERTLWDEQPTRTEAVHSLLAALHASQDLLDEARRSRSSAHSIAAAQALVARVRALSAGDVNSMVFTANPVEDLDTETAASSSEPFNDDDIALPDQDNAASPPSDKGGGAQAENAVGMGQSLADAQQPSARSEGEAAAVSNASRDRLSIPLATEFDEITDVTGQGDSATWRELRAQARADTAPLKEKLERALSADERTRWRREQERGEIDRTALAKLATSPGYRTPFRTQRAAKGRDVAVSLLIDRSGSMAGRKIELARLCASALCDALTQLSFDCEVLGYCSLESAPMKQLYERQLAGGADLRRYNRFVERLDLKVYKRFGATDLSGIAEIDCGHENPDGEALAWAATRLADHQTERRHPDRLLGRLSVDRRRRSAGAALRSARTRRGDPQTRHRTGRHRRADRCSRGFLSAQRGGEPSRGIAVDGVFGAEFDAADALARHNAGSRIAAGRGPNYRNAQRATPI